MVLDVPEGVKLLWVIESFRQFHTFVSLANIYLNIVIQASLVTMMQTC